MTWGTTWLAVFLVLYGWLRDRYRPLYGYQFLCSALQSSIGPDFSSWKQAILLNKLQCMRTSSPLLHLLMNAHGWECAGHSLWGSSRLAWCSSRSWAWGLWQ